MHQFLLAAPSCCGVLFEVCPRHPIWPMEWSVLPRSHPKWILDGHFHLQRWRWPAVHPKFVILLPTCSTLPPYPLWTANLNRGSTLSFHHDSSLPTACNASPRTWQPVRGLFESAGDHRVDEYWPQPICSKPCWLLGDFSNCASPPLWQQLPRQCDPSPPHHQGSFRIMMTMMMMPPWPRQ